MILVSHVDEFVWSIRMDDYLDLSTIPVLANDTDQVLIHKVVVGVYRNNQQLCNLTNNL